MITRQQFVERNTLLVEDLRNPENKQATGRLRTMNGYCCLGRACEVFHDKTGEGVWAYDQNNYYFSGFSMEPDRRVAEWFGWPAQNPELKPGTTTMAYLNDDTRLSFREIADLLEIHIDTEKENYPEGQ